MFFDVYGSVFFLHNIFFPKQKFFQSIHNALNSETELDFNNN